MKTRIKHLILTPFNFSFVFNKAGPVTDEWMEKRMEIFLNVTYPSLMSQTVMDFTWIVGFNPTTPTKWKEKIRKIKGISAVYATELSEKVWPDIIKSYVDDPYLLTTRIDSDDAFANNAIELIQSQMINLQPRYINFLHGFVSDGKETYLLDYESNSFVSRLETVPEARSVRVMDHSKVRGTQYFQQVVDAPPIWLIYIHSLNFGWTMEKTKRGHLRSHRLAPEDALANFNIKI